MKKRVGILIGIITVAAAIFGIQYGLRLYLQGTPKPFDAIVLMGESKAVSDAKKEFQNEMIEEKSFFYKEFEEKDESGEVYGVSMVISKEISEMLMEHRILRIKTADDPTSGDLDTKPLEYIEGLEKQDAFYLGYPNGDVDLQLGGVVVKANYTGYGWVGYTPTKYQRIAIVNNDVYDQVDAAEQKLILLTFGKTIGNLRNKADTQPMHDRMKSHPDVLLNFVKCQ